MKLLGRLVLHTLAILIAAYVVPGVRVTGIMAAVSVAVMLGIVNTFVKPIVKILSLPATILTLGLFLFVVNGFMVWLVANIVPGFAVKSFITAIVFSVVLSLVSWFLEVIARDR